MRNDAFEIAGGQEGETRVPQPEDVQEGREAGTQVRDTASNEAVRLMKSFSWDSQFI